MHEHKPAPLFSRKTKAKFAGIAVGVVVANAVIFTAALLIVKAIFFK